MPWRSILVALVATVTLAGCGGGRSAQDKAKDQVCTATADVAQRVSRLDALTVSQLDPTQALQELTAVGIRLRQVRDALPNLDAATASRLRGAEAAFQERFGQVVNGLVGGLTLGTSKIARDLAPDLHELVARWRLTIAPATRGWCG